MRYVHLARDSAHEAAERVAASIAEDILKKALLNGPRPLRQDAGRQSFPSSEKLDSPFSSVGEAQSLPHQSGLTLRGE